jgi:ABC-type multidrug transport system fused ATPase/permease subunit
MSHIVEIRHPGAAPGRTAIADVLEIGRDCDGVLVDDPAVSRRHARLEVSQGELVVRDLGSTNGTMVNSTRIDGPVVLRLGDIVTVGPLEIEVVGALVPAEGPPPPPPPPPRPLLDQLEARRVDGVVIRFRSGTAGERAAPAMAGSIRRAARRLSGLGPELRTLAPQICLVDPFPDPGHPDQMMTSGSVVDAGRREIWMVVTPESPAEPVERPLALLLGAALPSAAEATLLLEGLGLAATGAPPPNNDLQALDLPPLDEAEGEVRTAMAHSFVAFLLEHGGRDELLRLLHTSPPGGLDAMAKDLYGQGLTGLEEDWLESLRAPASKVRTGAFLRLTVRYLRPHLRRELEIFVWMLLALGFTTAFPFVMRRLFDSALPKRDLGEALRLVGFLGGTFVVSLLAGLRRAYLSAFVSSAVTRDIRVTMFSRLQRLSAGWFSRQQEGDILARLFSDVAQMEQGVSQTIREGIFQVLSLVVSGVVLLMLNPLLGAIILFGAPLVGLVYKVMSAGALKRSLAVQEELGSTYTVASENYGAQAVVKAFGLEDREQERFEQASGRLFGREVRLHLFGGIFGLSVSMIATALQLVVLGFGSWLILHDRLTPGGLVAFTTMMGQVLSPVTALTGLGQMMQMASGSLMRINEVIDAPPDIADDGTETELPPLAREIRLEGVGFSYTPARPTLADVSCVILAGSRVAFVGPTGAGKSSVLQLIMRFYDVDDGAVLFDDHDVREVGLSSLRAQLGVVFQETFLFDTTVRENIAMGRPGASDADIEAAARAAELHDFIETMPRGYNTLVGERGGRLSGGQRQRLAIARALLRDPRVLLLDEATSALDPRTERLISATLERVSQGRTTIAVTHRLTSITTYDHIFVMSEGRLAERGTHPELVARGGLYAELWAEQTGGIVPVETPFDGIAALAAVPLFTGLSPDELASAARRLQAVHLGPGERIPEGGGTLAIVRSGRPYVLTPGLGGHLVASADLEPGDAFGVSALLGEETGAVLATDAPADLLVLDSDATAALAAAHPSVAAALAGAGPAAAAPAGGERLSRASMVIRPSRGPAAPIAGAPTPEEIRRMSGAFRAVQR